MRTYHTLEQEAARLHMGKTKLRELVHGGKIPARRAPGGVRAPFLFDPDEVDAVILSYADNGPVSATPATPAEPTT